MALIGLIALLGSCSQDQVLEPQTEKGTPVRLGGYVMPFEDNGQQASNARRPNVKSTGNWGMTRTEPAWMPEGYSTLSSYQAIGAFFTTDTPSPTSDARRIWFNTNDDTWYILGENPPVGNFRLYGYMPYNAAMVTVAPNDTYEKGATLTFTNMGSVMTRDICVVVGASHGSDEDTPSDLAIGKFACTMKSGEGVANENHLFLLCEHLYSKLEFCFRVDNSAPYYYASLRTIKLRRLELTAYTFTQDNLSDLTIMKNKGNIIVNLAANNSGESPIAGTIYFTPDGTSGNMEPVVLFTGEETLPSAADTYTKGTGYVPYFNLSNETKMLYRLRSIYDVYDRKGNLIRKNCEAVNTLRPQDRFGIKQLNRGTSYKLQLTVVPTFAYVLSDPDLDNPTIED